MLRFALFTAFLLPFTAMAQSLDKPAVEAVIKDYLIKNPEVVVDALNAYQDKRRQEDQANAKKVIQDRKKELTEDKAAPSVGSKRADVVVVQFFDYHCGYCKQMLPVVNDVLAEDKKVRFVFREFPILSEDSTLAAKAALSVYKLDADKYFAFHSALMKASGKFDLEMLKAEAKKLGINEKKLEETINSKEIADEIGRTRELAKALNINGTPAIIVGDDILPGATDVAGLKRAIAKARGA